MAKLIFDLSRRRGFWFGRWSVYFGAFPPGVPEATTASDQLFGLPNAEPAILDLLGDPERFRFSKSRERLAWPAESFPASTMPWIESGRVSMRSRFVIVLRSLPTASATS